MTTIANTIRTLAVATVLANGFTIASGVALPSTAEAAAPQACVQQVMTGGINWGGGTTWQRKNAEALCEGAGDYGARIRCFTGAVAGGTHWSQAIKSCQPIGKKVATGGVINGYSVGVVHFAGGTFEKRGNGWVETGASGQVRFHFKEQQRDEWSVYLHDSSRNVNLQLDLHRDLVLYEGSPLYPITSVAKAKAPRVPKKPHVYTINAGPIWNQADAQQKCPKLAKKRGATWTGHWWTTQPGKMSVCQLKR